VAVYGASSDPGKLSGRPLAFLKSLGYPGELYAINPRRDVVQDVVSYPDVASVPGIVDLAIVVVPADAVIPAIQKCADAGVGAAIIFASGFAEVGGPGRSAQEELTRISRSSGMRILGPNCLGSFSSVTKAYATFSTAFDTPDGGQPPTSPIALVSQSGAVGTFTYSAMEALGVGVSYFANTGNEADMTVVEILAALVDAPDVDVLLGHLEGVKDMSALADLARAANESGKPLVLLKSGRSEAGARAVGAHTASVAGDDDAFSEVLAEHGAIRVKSMEAWADAALAFKDGRRGLGRRLSIVTLSGGAGALASDKAVEIGLRVDTWQDAPARQELADRLPFFGSVANPIDVTGSTINDVGILRHVLDVTTAHEETDAVLVVMGNADASAREIVDALISSYRSTTKPFMVSWTGGSGQARADLLAAGVPTYTDADRAVVSLGLVIERGLLDAVRVVSASASAV